MVSFHAFGLAVRNGPTGPCTPAERADLTVRTTGLHLHDLLGGHFRVREVLADGLVEIDGPIDGAVGAVVRRRTSAADSRVLFRGLLDDLLQPLHHPVTTNHVCRAMAFGI